MMADNRADDAVNDISRHAIKRRQEALGHKRPLMRVVISRRQLTAQMPLKLTRSLAHIVQKPRQLRDSTYAKRLAIATGKLRDTIAMVNEKLAWMGIESVIIYEHG